MSYECFFSQRFRVRRNRRGIRCMGKLSSFLNKMDKVHPVAANMEHQETMLYVSLMSRLNKYTDHVRRIDYVYINRRQRKKTRTAFMRCFKKEYCQ